MPTTLTALPATITAGDSYAITLSFSDYPATAGWAIKCALAGVSVLEVTSVANGAAHDLTLSATVTAALNAGTYQYRLRAVNGAQAHTLETGVVAVVADLATLGPGDGQSWAEKTLAVVEAVLANTATAEMKMYMIGGRQVQLLSLAELRSLRQELRAELATMRRGSSLGKVSVRFVR